MVKTYISKESFSLSTSVFVDGKEFVIEFENGVRYPVIRNGIFSTDRIDLQKAMENSCSYGVKYELLRTHRISKEKTKKKSDDIKSVDTVKSKQMAIEWIRINLKREFTAASDPLLIKEFALSNNILFNNWN